MKTSWAGKIGQEELKLMGFLLRHVEEGCVDVAMTLLMGDFLCAVNDPGCAPGAEHEHEFSPTSNQ